MSRPRQLALLGVGLALCALAGVARAQAASEAAVKAAFLYKFAGYVEWPARASPADAPLVIGVSGADDVAAELERIVPGRRIGARPLLVLRVREGEALRGVHILFVGEGQPNPRPLLRAAQQQGALTVTAHEQGLEVGAVVNFVPFDDRLGFEVSVDAAERIGLRISSRMLAVARRVVGRS